MTTRVLSTLLVFAAGAALAACGPAAPSPRAQGDTSAGTSSASVAVSAMSHPAGHGVTVTDAWVKAAPAPDGMAMTAAFGTVTNPTDTDITLVAVSQDVSARTEIHETVQEAGRAVMRELAGGLVVPAGGSVELKPGGHHLMLMDLKRALPVGAEVRFTARTSTGQELRWTAPAKQFTAPRENYVPGHATTSSDGPGETRRPSTVGDQPTSSGR